MDLIINKLKKYSSSIISLFLIIFLLFQLIGYIVFFKIQQYNIHTEMKQKIGTLIKHQDDIILLKIPITIEKNNYAVFQRMQEWEFRYFGYMFDVVSKEIHNDTTWYYCIYDKKETQLLKDLERILKQKNSETKLIKNRIFNLFSVIFCFNKQNFDYKDLVINYELIAYEFSIITWISIPLTHPPRFYI